MDTNTAGQDNMAAVPPKAGLLPHYGFFSSERPTLSTRLCNLILSTLLQEHSSPPVKLLMEFEEVRINRV